MKDVQCGTLVNVQVKDSMHNLHTVSAVCGAHAATKQRPFFVDRAAALHRHDDVHFAVKLWTDDKFVLFTSGVSWDTTPAGTHDGCRGTATDMDWSKNRWYVTTAQNWADAGLPANA
jgi:hypothetical protein